MIILGAGMAGCLAGIVNPKAEIYEAQKNTAFNHRAVLRFRSDSVSKVTGIPFRKVKVYKGIWYNSETHPITPQIIAWYSKKVLGYITARSITNIDPICRYIAPPDFHAQLIDMLSNRIRFNSPVDPKTLKFMTGPKISTIPMELMAKMTGEHIVAKFHYRSIETTRLTIHDCDIHMTMYYPDMDMSTYRATLTGSDLIIEHQGELPPEELQEVFISLGLFNIKYDIVEENHVQRYGKILDINDKVRKDFIFRLSANHDIYSLGRFAIWKNILLDDVLDDLYVIRRLIASTHYDRSKLL